MALSSCTEAIFTSKIFRCASEQICSVQSQFLPARPIQLTFNFYILEKKKQHLEVALMLFNSCIEELANQLIRLDGPLLYNSNPFQRHNHNMKIL